MNSMDEYFYKKIREENEKKYGTDVSVYGPVLLANLYSDRTHFIYELLQNAEDACERARKQGKAKRFAVRFELYPDRLEVRHNGIPFTENDVKGISRIVGAVKDQNISQIGKFGIGFKSVYAYTNAPEVYSGDKNFYNKDYVYPYPKEFRKDVQTGETLFVIRFDKIERKDQAHSEIENRLRNLSARTLLFLKNIEEISYSTGPRNGRYLRILEEKKDARTVTLQYVENTQERRKEKWLIFDKPLNEDANKRLEIAYQITYNNEAKKWEIKPAKDVKLFVYFQTEKETHLKFLIQGPYNTTPPRDNIHNDDWNRKLIKETAAFVAANIPKIKEMGLLNAEFLNTLPIETEHFTTEETMFEPIYNAVKDKLSSNEALLPTCEGDFATPQRSFIARGKDLRILLSGEQLDQLFKCKGSKWLDENITEDKTPELHEYLTEVLGVEEVYPERFAGAFNEEFISRQTDQWVISFYAFLLGQKALWKEADYSSERPGILRSKPIIRLQDNSHIAPFDAKGRPRAHLAHKDPAINKMFFHIVKDAITNDKRAREFLKSLGIDEPDKTAAIFEIILPKYKGNIAVSEKDNIQDVEWILKALEDSESARRDTLLNELMNTPILFAVNASDQHNEYRKPPEIHLGETYTEKKNLETYFEGNEKIWFLDKRYMALEDSSKITEKFKRLLHCKSGVLVNFKKPDFMGNVEIDYEYRYHSKGLDGFDPDCEIEGLEHALQHINIERARIIWQILNGCYKCICGEVEYSSRRNYEGSSKKRQNSKMGKMVTEHAWLPDSTLTFFKPSELMLSQLPDGFDKVSAEAKFVSEKLDMKPTVSQEIQAIIERVPDEAKEIVKIFVSASPEQQQRILESARNIKSSEKSPQVEKPSQELTNIITVSPSSFDLKIEFQQALEQEHVPEASSEDRTWAGPTPEQEEKMHKFANEDLAKLVQKPQIIETIQKKISFIKTEKEKESELRQFLLEQYKGHCQVCNTKLDLGQNKDPYFEIYRLIEKRREVGAWSDLEYNILCLCPNCHALMKYGGRDLQGVFDKARRVANNEDAPEEVDERGGDFYIVSIMIAGKERELFYSPFHMAKVSAFIKLVEDDSGESIHIQVNGGHREIFPYKCPKCGNCYTEDERQEDHFCRKCGTLLKHEKNI